MLISGVPISLPSWGGMDCTPLRLTKRTRVTQKDEPQRYSHHRRSLSTEWGSRCVFSKFHFGRPFSRGCNPVRCSPSVELGLGVPASQSRGNRTAAADRWGTWYFRSVRARGAAADCSVGGWTYPWSRELRGGGGELRAVARAPGVIIGTGGRSDCVGLGLGAVRRCGLQCGRRARAVVTTWRRSS